MPFTYEQGVLEAVEDYLHKLPPQQFLSLLIKAKRFDVISVLFAALSPEQREVVRVLLGDSPAPTKEGGESS